MPHDDVVPPRTPGPSISRLGDTALLVHLAGVDAPPPFDAVHAAARVLDQAGLPGAIEAVSAFETVAVYYDPSLTSHDALARAVRRALATDSPDDAARPTPREHLISVVYDGPDLSEVATRTGLTRDEVIARHAAVRYTVHALGFVPGFGYLGEVDPRLHLPRRDRPRTRVPAGSVAIAGTQTAVYPGVTPGGWHLIGRTDVSLFDVDRDPPALLAAGDHVRFIPR